MDAGRCAGRRGCADRQQLLVTDANSMITSGRCWGGGKYPMFLVAPRFMDMSSPAPGMPASAPMQTEWGPDKECCTHRDKACTCPRCSMNQADQPLAAWPACASITSCAMDLDQLTDRPVCSVGTPNNLQGRTPLEQLAGHRGAGQH